METLINFPDNQLGEAFGKRGWARMTGLVFRHDKHSNGWEGNKVERVKLCPITSRGEESRSCQVDLIPDPQTLRTLARQLNEAADRIESNQRDET